jgi:hypothetical protein
MNSRKDCSRNIRTIFRDKVTKKNKLHVDCSRLTNYTSAVASKSCKYLSCQKSPKNESFKSFNPYAYTGHIRNIKDIYKNHCSFYETISRKVIYQYFSFCPKLNLLSICYPLSFFNLTQSFSRIHLWTLE